MSLTHTGTSSEYIHHDKREKSHSRHLPAEWWYLLANSVPNLCKREWNRGMSVTQCDTNKHIHMQQTHTSTYTLVAYSHRCYMGWTVRQIEWSVSASVRLYKREAPKTRLSLKSRLCNEQARRVKLGVIVCAEYSYDKIRPA
jgi:hypothetical protein